MPIPLVLSGHRAKPRGCGRRRIIAVAPRWWSQRRPRCGEGSARADTVRTPPQPYGTSSQAHHGAAERRHTTEMRKLSGNSADLALDLLAEPCARPPCGGGENSAEEPGAGARVRQLRRNPAPAGVEPARLWQVGTSVRRSLDVAAEQQTRCRSPGSAAQRPRVAVEPGRLRQRAGPG
jgi:hypothetical protein